MRTQTPRYWSYLMRCWEEPSQTPDQPVLWRFSLEDVETGQRRGFHDLEALVAFLYSQTSQARPDSEPDVPLSF